MKNLSAALVKAQGELHAPVKNRTVRVKSDKGSYTFDYATLDGIVEGVLRPVLPNHGLWFTQFYADGQMMTRIIHESGEYLDAGVPMPSLPSKPQEAGSILSYFKRYSLCSAFALVAEEDDDANVASGNTYEATPKADPTPKLINAAQRDLLATTAGAKGVTAQQICERYQVADLLKLTVDQAKAELARLEKLEVANA